MIRMIIGVFMLGKAQKLLKTTLFCCLSFMFLQNTHASSNANQMISGILSYITWDSHLNQINFCVVDGTPKFISKNIFSPPSPLIQPTNIKVFSYTFEQLIQTPSTSCNVFYFVQTSDNQQQQIINSYPTKIVTISENNQDCSVGSSFCIYQSKNQYKFKVNLDALKKSQIRINSKVLLLSQQQEEL